MTKVVQVHSSLLLIYIAIFNPLDKVVGMYERLLESEREKVELLKVNIYMLSYLKELIVFLSPSLVFTGKSFPKANLIF